MESKCMFCGSDLDTGMDCRNPDCESHEPIYINRACAPNCPGNIKPRTPAEAEALVVRVLVASRVMQKAIDDRKRPERVRELLNDLNSKKAAVLAALTGGGE